MQVIGMDVGGGGVRAARVGPGCELGRVVEFPLPDRQVKTVLDTVATVMAELQRDGPGIDRLGVGFPGFIRQGRVLASPNFPRWRDVPLERDLAHRLGIEVRVENDANAAALGAFRLRGGRSDLLLLTLGTGVGGGVVIDGRLFRGSGGTGAEVGHIYVGGERPCNCGGVGCLETWTSNVGLVQAAQERGQEVQNGAEVVTRADAGEPWAKEALYAAGEALGRGLVTLINLFNPQVVLITGGLAAARHHLWPPARRRLEAHGVPPSVQWAQVIWEGRADPFAICGAAAAARFEGPAAASP